MRLKLMMLAPALIGDISNRLQRFTDIAELEITGILENGRTTKSNEGAKIFQRTKELLRADTKRFVDAKKTPAEIQAMTLEAIETGGASAILLSSAPGAAGLAFDALLLSFVVSTWTAFETLAGDLWEEALNGHPHGLSALKGAKNAFSGFTKPVKQKLDSDQEQRQSPDQTISLSQVERHGFDLRMKMGSALRDDQRFDSLGGIRQAYARAFFEKNDGIRDAIRDKALDATSCIRNLIVHRSGIADLAYTEQSKFLDIPKLAVGESLKIDGEFVSTLIDEARKASIKLIVQIDDWAAKN
jgi:hypothetical protein